MRNLTTCIQGPLSKVAGSAAVALLILLVLLVVLVWAQYSPVLDDIVQLVARVAQLESKVRSLQSTTQQLEQEIDQIKRGSAQTRSAMNSALPRLRNFAQGHSFGFDIQDPSYHAKRQQIKECAAAQFITTVVTYMEDGHIKMAFICKELPNVQLQFE